MKRYAPIIIAILLLVSIFGFGYIEAFINLFGVSRIKTIERTPLFVLAWQHLMLAGLPTLLALAFSLVAGCALHLLENPELTELAMSASSIGETFPSIALIALSVPVLGYGSLPCMLALFIYAILPILRNTVTGLAEVGIGVREAARGVGMGRLQRLMKVELPLAFPIILTGLKIALVINISAATLGASVGAGGLGVPIITGIRTYEPLMVVKGTLPVLLMALLADSLLRSRRTE
jgi:osmoprotectant transport system permease protein